MFGRSTTKAITAGRGGGTLTRVRSTAPTGRSWEIRSNWLPEADTTRAGPIRYGDANRIQFDKI